MDEEKRFQIALSLVPGVGNVNTKNLISYCGSAKQVFNSKPNVLSKIPGIGQKTIASIQKSTILHETDAIIASCQKKNYKILYYTDTEYPSRLKLIADSPSILYFSGNGNFNSAKSIAIVGTRNATEYGKEITRSIVEELSQSDVIVNSGLAYGVDIEAHKSCLENGVPTFGVMANGHNKIYPSQHKKIAMKMLDNGGLFSENPPEKQAQAHFFPARNRIIAGLSDAVIIVEAAARGGALITANIADSYNKYVFAVPGSIGAKYSEGCNELIRNQKAYIYTGIKDLNYYLNWDQPVLARKEKNMLSPDQFSEEEFRIYQTLFSEPDGLHIDEIAWKSQVMINEAATHLLTLEFRSIVKSLPGKKFKLA